MGTVLQNAERQLQLLWQALWLLAAGGELVYSTCALSDHENQKVIQKLTQAAATVPKLVFEVLETRFTLPDESAGAGPLFCCRLRKKSGPIGMPPRLPNLSKTR